MSDAHADSSAVLIAQLAREIFGDHAEKSGAHDGADCVATGVAWGRAASTLYVWIGSRCGRIAARSLRVEPGENLAREPHDVLRFDEHAVEWLDVAVSADEFLARGALLRAALM